jgi:hypothetical protein
MQAVHPGITEAVFAVLGVGELGAQPPVLWRHGAAIRYARRSPAGRTFFGRYVIDEGYGGLAFEDEGERCAALLADPKHSVMIMGNHGLLVLGTSVADAFNRLYYFERSAETYIRALQTGRPLRLLSDEIAEKVAASMDFYPDQAERHFADLRSILDRDEPDYRD